MTDFPTDAEGENNGLITCDRQVLKLPAAELAKLHAVLTEWQHVGLGERHAPAFFRDEDRAVYLLWHSASQKVRRTAGVSPPVCRR